MLGLKELALVATVVLVLYGRSGVVKSRQFQAIWPWLAPVRRTPRRPGVQGGAVVDRPRVVPSSSNPSPSAATARPARFRLEGNRLFWFLTILAATAVTSWIVTRLLILHGAASALAR